MNTRFNRILAVSAVLAGLMATAQVQAADLSPAAPSDAALAAAVKAALLEAKPYHDADVSLKVSAHAGQVDLSGWVSYANDATAAVDIASMVDGVKNVTSHLHSWSAREDLRI